MALSATQIGGGLFTGRANYSSGVFATSQEDVSDLISMVSPREAPFLTMIGDTDYEAKNIWHEFLEEELSPNVIVNSTAVSSATTDTQIAVKGGLASFLQPGMIIRFPEVSGGEYGQIVSVAAPTITVSRAFASTVANSFGIGEYITIISDAAVEGADVQNDTSRPRTRLGNYMHLFKKDIIVSTSAEAVSQYGVESEWDHQKLVKSAEAVRDLEKACILSRLSGNTLGSSTQVRTMKGLLQWLGTTVSSITSTSYTGTYDSTQIAAFESYIADLISRAWTQGGTDLDVIMCGEAVKRRFDMLNQSRVRTLNQDNAFVQRITMYECTYGAFPVVLNRWMPTHIGSIIAKRRIKVVPLKDQSFRFEEVAKTGMARKGMIFGEYTMELKNEAAMGQINFAALAPGTLGRLIPAN